MIIVKKNLESFMIKTIHAKIIKLSYNFLSSHHEEKNLKSNKCSTTVNRQDKYRIKSDLFH